MFSCCSCNRKEKKDSENDEESEESSSSSSQDSSDQVIETVEEIKFTDFVIIPLKDENYVEEEEEEEENQEDTVESKELNIQKNLEKIIEDVEEITVNVDVLNSDNTLDKMNDKNVNQDDNKEDSCSLGNSAETVVNIEDKNDTQDDKNSENIIDSSSEKKNDDDSSENKIIEEIKNDEKEILQDVKNETTTLCQEEEEEEKEEEQQQKQKEEEEDVIIKEKILIENNQNDDEVVLEELNKIEPVDDEKITDNINIDNDMQEIYDNNNDVIEISTSFVDPDDEIINDKIIEEDEQEDNYESKESSSSKSSVIMAVNSDEIDNKINGDTVTTPETISPELTKKEFNNDEQLINNNNNETIDIKLDINYENNNNDVSSKNSQSSNSSEEALNICKITIEKGVLGPPKSNGLFHAPGYIERTLIVGPDEDGDDSVFERSITVEESAPGGVNNNIVVDDDDEEEDLIDKNSSILQKPIIRWLSQEDDDSLEVSGMLEPPATPIAKDELALRRHKFFSDLIHATNLSANHKVHFDPLGPLVHPGCDSEREDHLEELVTRLENVTKRLESVPEKFIVETQEVAIQTQTPSPKRTNKFIEKSESIEQSIDIENNIEINLNNINSSSNMSIENYEDIIAGPVAEYLKLSEKIGGDVASHGKLVQQAFQIQLQYIKTASSRAAPSSQTEQVSLLGPLSSQIQAIQEYREKNRGSQYFNHLSAISESIPALGWVAVSPTPAPYVKEMNDAGQFYTNRVLKDWKEKDKTHVEWCKNWVQTLSDLQKYIRQYHTTGLVWSKNGGTGVAAAPPPPPSCGMPPPPPSMPIGEIDSLNINDDRSALFAQINKGEDITKSLKKVTSDMQTHKNPSIRSGPAPFKAPVVNNSGATMKTTLPANAPIDKPPVFNRDGKKWLVEYQKGNKNLLIEDAEMNNVVYMYRCQDSTIVIKGKINSVVMDSCRKSSVVFDSLVSSIEFVNCQSVQMQVLGKVPTISIDKTDGCQMYLNSDSLNVEVISSKSSEMNVMVPKGNGDYTEYPVPEQFKTTVNPKGLTTICVDSLG